MLIFSLNENARKRRYKLEVSAYSLLTIIYFFVFCLLNQKMSKLDIGTIHADKMSIKCQFGIFMFAFATRTLYYIIQIMVSLDFNYTSALLEALFLIWWVIIPLTYMLFMHNRTFSQVLRKQRMKQITS